MGIRSHISTINKVNRIGRRRWKKTSRYHQQARAENAFFRYKSTIGHGLRARTPGGQTTEVVLACNIPNAMTDRGWPDSYPLAGEPPLVGIVVARFRFVQQRQSDDRPGKARLVRHRSVKDLGAGIVAGWFRFMHQRLISAGRLSHGLLAQGGAPSRRMANHRSYPGASGHHKSERLRLRLLFLRLLQ